MSPINPLSSLPTDGIARLSSLALITVSGADAIQFLHSQLTNDIQALADNQACLAGYCTPKGRLLATAIAWKTGDTVTLEVPAEIRENLQKRLQMYVLRSRVTLENRTASVSVLGIFGEGAALKLAEWFPMLPAAPNQLVHNKSGVLLRLTDVTGIKRYQWIAPLALADQVYPTLSRQISVVPEQSWALSDIHGGIPQILPTTQEKFVPQMINYELIGGVNFKKGCYPGQEIVARSQYLGKQKRRMVLASIPSATVQSGMELFSATDSSEPCGMIVNAAPNARGGSDCLIEMKTSFLQNATVQLGTGEVCQWMELPYPLPRDGDGVTS